MKLLLVLALTVTAQQLLMTEYYTFGHVCSWPSQWWNVSMGQCWQIRGGQAYIQFYKFTDGGETIWVKYFTEGTNCPPNTYHWDIYRPRGKCMQDPLGSMSLDWATNQTHIQWPEAPSTTALDIKVSYFYTDPKPVKTINVTLGTCIDNAPNYPYSFHHLMPNEPDVLVVEYWDWHDRNCSGVNRGWWYMENHKMTGSHDVLYSNWQADW